MSCRVNTGTTFGWSGSRSTVDGSAHPKGGNEPSRSERATRSVLRFVGSSRRAGAFAPTESVAASHCPSDSERGKRRCSPCTDATGYPNGQRFVASSESSRFLLDEHRTHAWSPFFPSFPPRDGGVVTPGFVCLSAPSEAQRFCGSMAGACVGSRFVATGSLCVVCIGRVSEAQASDDRSTRKKKMTTPTKKQQRGVYRTGVCSWRFLPFSCPEFFIFSAHF